MEVKLVKAEFFSQPTPDAARQLIGKTLVRQTEKETMTCRIVEAEAYLSTGDAACHAAKKRTPRNEVMFGKPGLIYVYAIHAKFCFNLVTEREGQGCAVLVRAGMPLEGIESMKMRRGVEDQRNLLSGPAKLCQALDIDKSHNGLTLSKANGLWLVDDGFSPSDNEIRVTPRIGVTSAKNKLLRYVLKGSGFASGPKSLR